LLNALVFFGSAKLTAGSTLPEIMPSRSALLSAMQVRLAPVSTIRVTLLRLP
jgi:hypothetical protein